MPIEILTLKCHTHQMWKDIRLISSRVAAVIFSSEPRVNEAYSKVIDLTALARTDQIYRFLVGQKSGNNYIR